MGTHVPVGGGRDDVVEEILARSLRVLAAICVLSALTSATFFHPDEHFQVVEFAGFKLGFTRPEELPWEYAARIRSWLQPALYTLLGKALLAVGVTDRFVLLAAFRLVTVAIAIAALSRLSRVAVRELPSDRMRRAYAAMLPWIGFFPYLFARTSSETLSGACLAVAVARAWDSRAFGHRTAALVGALLGVAFEARFQTAFASVGLVAWLTLVRRVSVSKLAVLVVGGLAVVAVSALVDRWGYGSWVFPPLAYVRENLVHGVANSFGREPFWAYPLLVVVNVFAPLALASVVAVGLAATRFPRHVSTFVVVPFVLAHSLVAHKEERFLFPLAFFVPVLLVLAFVTRAEGPHLPRALRVALAASLVVMGAQLVRPLGFRAQIHFARALEARSLGGARAIALPGSEYPRYPFLRTNEVAVEPLAGGCLPSATELVYGEAPVLELPRGCAGEHFEYEVLASDWPFVESAAWALASSRFMARWNALRAQGAPLPWLHAATLVRVRVPR